MPDPASALAAHGWGGREEPGPGLQPGRVLRVERTEAEVFTAARQVRCAVGTALAVGDWVAVDAWGRIDSVLPRSSALTRLDPSGSGEQVLAANVDLVVVTAPADRLSPARVERELMVAWASGARPLVVVTKSDAVADGAGVLERLRRRVTGVEVLAASGLTGEGVPALRGMLRPSRTAVLLGPSGAGKSSLTNALVGSDLQATGAVREDRRGRHTTSNRQLLLVPGGGVVIDTPGLRAVGLGEGLALADVFPDLEALGSSCRFADCSHRSEPGCAVRAALADGTVDPARVASWEKLAAEVAPDAAADPVARREAVESAKLRAREAKAQRRRR